MAGSYCKYKKEIYEVSYDGGVSWRPHLEDGHEVYRTGELLQCNAPECGFIEPQSRWENMNINSDFICDNFNKYYKQLKYWSYDGGAHWEPSDPPEYQKGDLYEANSYDCDYGVTWVRTEEGFICELAPIERWMLVASEYICGTEVDGDLYVKYQKFVKQISTDGGTTWNSTDEYKKGDIIDEYSVDCGYKTNIGFKYTILITGNDVTDKYPFTHKIGVPIRAESFDVDNGDGQIYKNATTGYKHTYNKPGRYTVTITNIKPSYDIHNDAIYANSVFDSSAAFNTSEKNLFEDVLISIDDWGNERFTYTYKNKEHNVNMYWQSFVFENCKNLVNIPLSNYNIFSNYIPSNYGDTVNVKKGQPIKNLFYNCPKLILNGNLFNGIADNSFIYNQTFTPYGLFEKCGFTSIPEDLFKSCNKQKTLKYAFRDCKNLLSIPKNLFQNCNEVENYTGCFMGCTNLTGETPSVSIDNVEYKLWELAGKPGFPSEIQGNMCFQDCINLTDYGNIPSDWK